MGKESEVYFKETMNHYGWSSHKYGDVRYCPHCHGVLPKSETMPDYVLMPLPILVECKNSDKGGSWSWKSDIGPEGTRAIQRIRLGQTNGWLYIVIGNGRAPAGKSAWLIQWEAWLAVEKELVQASIPLEDTRQLMGARRLFQGFELVWEKGVFSIPRGHPFWDVYALKLKDEFVRASGMAMKVYGVANDQ